MYVGFTSFEGHVPEVATSSARTHCDRCQGELRADAPHYCPDKTREQLMIERRELIPETEKVHEGGPEVDAAAAKQATGESSQEDSCLAAAASLTEQQKYEAMWKEPAYRAVAPGEALASLFLAQPNGPKPGSEVIDFGAGTGRGALLLALLGQCKVKMVDFAGNSLDDDMRQMLDTQAHALSFIQHDLSKPLGFTAEYGFCTDVMEHIPPAQVDDVLKNILQAAQHVFFQISCGDDVCGKLIDEPLHLSVHDYDWWRAKFLQFDARIHWSENRGGTCLFYVTAWALGDDIQKACILNIEEDQIRKNVRTNCLGAWQQMSPHRANNNELILLCGGPSLDSQLETIKELRAEGAGTVTMNGTYHWAIEHQVYPGCQIVCDARPHNVRFVQPMLEECKYLIASQCDPEVFAQLPPGRTYMWHTTADAIRDILSELLPQWWGVPGGCTVLLRAIPMLRMLGFQKFHLFGADSCLMDGKHHAYAQAENDGQLVIPVNVGGKTFHCHPWMIAQAQEWMNLIKYFGETFQVEVYGDGLLAWIMEHAADEDLKDEVAAAKLEAREQSELDAMAMSDGPS